MSGPRSSTGPHPRNDTGNTNETHLHRLDGGGIDDVVQHMRHGRRLHHNRPDKRHRGRNANGSNNSNEPWLTAGHSRAEHWPCSRYDASAKPNSSGYLRRFFDVARHIRHRLATAQRRRITTPPCLMALRRGYGLRPLKWTFRICRQSIIATAPRNAVAMQSGPRTWTAFALARSCFALD